MNVLVIGSGGREHAMCWKIAQSPLLENLYCAPGNPGIAEVAERVPIGVGDLDALAEFVRDQAIDLTVVGPELPLTLGLVDKLQAKGHAVFGPSRAAAQLEGSKIFAKEFMQRHGIPTAEFFVTRDEKETREAVAKLGLPVVLKADGLAAGKGVLIPKDESELDEALGIFFEERRFGESGARLVVEECMTGEEVSVIALSDGEQLLSFAASKDYKRIGEGDTGPNTGGMGAHSPSGVLSREVADWTHEEVMRPTIDGMKAEGHPFVGVLYAGLMLTPAGPRVLEFNVRLGDPEAQPLMIRLDEDLLPILEAGARGSFGATTLKFRSESAACIVLASEGYPAKPADGDPIAGIEKARSYPGVEVFHAGTDMRDGQLVASGGRVLNVCALGEDLQDALEHAYRAAAEIEWDSKVFRSDIGQRVLLQRRD